MFLDDSVPLATRKSLDLQLMVAERVLVTDPVQTWAKEWNIRRRPKSADLDTVHSELTKILIGLEPLRREIVSGGIILLRPPTPTTDKGARLLMNPTARDIMRDIYEPMGFGSERVDNDFKRVIPNSFSFQRLYFDMNDWLGGEGPWKDVANRVFPEGGSGSAVALSRAIMLDSYTSLNGITPAPSGEIARFFDLGRPDVPDSNDQIDIFSIPRIQLTLSDALALRAGDETFALFRSAVRQMLESVRMSAESESPGDYATRIRSAAAEILSPFEEKFMRLRDRGMLFRMLPGAVGGAVGLSLKAVHLPSAGANSAVAWGVRSLIADDVKEADASAIALRYSMNLRLGGGL
jgi:hypothetical protein